MSDKEKVAQWMMSHGYATGHGTTVADLLQELEWQVAEREREARAIGLVLTTLNLDDVYPTQRELLREALEAAKKSQEQIVALTAMCETLNKLQETAVDMIKPAMESAVLKEREACAELAAWILKMPQNDVSEAIRARSKT